MNFDQALEKINQAYYKLGHNQYERGYRFLLTTKANFSSHTDIVLLSQNPGGDSPIPGQSPYSCEYGPAYLIEQRSSKPLQIQVQKLFQELSKHIPGNRDLIYEALIAYFIPFRTPEIKKLPAKKESIEFSLNLWKEILSSIQPKLILCLGKEVSQNVTKIFSDQSYKLSKEKLNWGDVTGEVYKYEGGLRVLGLPHLSRFRVFNKSECYPPINKLLEEATQNW
jgi:hypothetical protein